MEDASKVKVRHEEMSQMAMHAEKHLFATTAFVGKFLRNRAVERLFSNRTREAAVVLASVIEKEHPEADAILRRLLLLQNSTEPVMHSAIWNYWKSHRFDALLKKANAAESFYSDLQKALVAMPQSDWGNDMVFMLWSLLDSDVIAEHIESGCRHAPSLEMDALFGLVRGNPERYLGLEDPDYSIFEKAWLAASGVQRQRISMTVLNSQNARLVAAYDHAVTDEHDPQLVIEAFKLSGDHDALFDRLYGLSFNTGLDVIAFWEQSEGRPRDPSRKAVAEQAVALYRELSGLLMQSRFDSLPGTRDIFSFWTEQYQSDELIQRDLSNPEPFRRAGALFTGVQRGLVPRHRLQEISQNGTWPEKLALQYLYTLHGASPDNEHVCWLRPQDNIVAGILETRMPGSLEESSRLIDELQKASAPVDDREIQIQYKLLQMLTLIQGYFLRGIITVDSSHDATEKNAVETEDLADMEW